MEENKLDKLIKQNITIDDLQSDDFINNIMISCYRYDNRRRKIKIFKKYSILSLPIIFTIIILFIPDINIFQLVDINWIYVLKYYIFSSLILITSFYIILFEKIYKFFKLKIIY